MTKSMYLPMIRGEQTTHTPVWFMRQAGRSQAEYRKIKEKYTLFQITQQPDLCAYVTALPVQEYGVDAAILYKDIMTPMPGMGVDVEIKKQVGPVIANPIRTLADVEALRDFEPDKLPYIWETIRLLTTDILQVPLIGFCGAPFTLASYLVEGGPSKTYMKTRSMLLSAPDVWHPLMRKLTTMCIEYLSVQVRSGVQAIQIFDSWVGALSPAGYEMGIYPYMNELVSAVKARHPEVPITLFGVGAGHLLPQWKTLPVDVIGLDWRSRIEDATVMGVTQTIQGNLDPAYLLADWDTVRPEIDRILAAGKAHGKHIFNLGHGIMPEANPDMIRRIAAYVQEASAK